MIMKNPNDYNIITYEIWRCIIMVADKIKILREKRGLTQSAVAKKLNITRSSVNAWEMGISVPSTQYIIELALLFDVSADFLLGIDKSSTLNVEGLKSNEIIAIKELIDCLKKRKKEL